MKHDKDSSTWTDAPICILFAPIWILRDCREMNKLAM